VRLSETIQPVDFRRIELLYVLKDQLNLNSFSSSPPYKSLILPTGRCKARDPILSFEKVRIRTNEFRWRLPDEAERHRPTEQ
jgi:hypothetical protein